MATHTLSPTSTPCSTRRNALGGGIAAFVAAASAVGITAGAAASVADLVPAGAEGDARLIALCTEYLVSDDRHRQVCAAQDSMTRPFSAEQDVEWNRLDDIACEESEMVGQLEDEIAELAATTPAGLLAKAQIMLRFFRNLEVDSGGPLARSMARDVLAVAL